MIYFVSGNMFDESADIRVNTVNCVGVMGKGVALEFKKRYPATLPQDYKRACKKGEVAPGKLHIYEVAVNYKIVNFPTKETLGGRFAIRRYKSGEAKHYTLIFFYWIECMSRCLRWGVVMAGLIGIK